MYLQTRLRVVPVIMDSKRRQKHCVNIVHCILSLKPMRKRALHIDKHIDYRIVNAVYLPKGCQRTKHAASVQRPRAIKQAVSLLTLHHSAWQDCR